MRAAFASLVILVSALGVMRLVTNAPGLDDLTPQGGRAGSEEEDARFLLFRNGAAAPADTLAAFAGDTLQISILSARAVHYAVYYRDDQGPLAAYFPPDPGRLAGSSQGENLRLSRVLGAIWRTETLYCLWSPRAFTSEDAVAAMGAAGVGMGADSLRLQIFVLRNGGR